ncbi:transcriptional regulator, TetR family [Saccharopolyspora shandongensis]|uniref:Transcriptional regulator, TetR family n=1 Tax=Saccharopolyspora shandongensis TaxID=418495 RepID=A0A1H3Q631_9PSEU|nr:TetR/AcrR family transcriptional regulator [Saccharopolyspora shandongensis]SDZ08964.1 transcriptional regulator, TetR family [Saccharopolyspora shandongensis]
MKPDALEGALRRPFAEPASDRVLDAAREAFEDVGIQRTTMRDIARRAGLGRATVYRRYPDRDAVVAAVLLREVRVFLAWLDERIDHIEDPAEQIAECFVAVVTGLRGHSLLNRLLTLEPAAALPAVTVDAGAVLAVARGYFAAKLREHQQAGRLRSFDPEPAAEVFVRLAHSMLLSPPGCIPADDDARSRAFARAHLVPVVTG